MKKLLQSVCLLMASSALFSAYAVVIDVNCTGGNSGVLSNTIAAAAPGTTINVTGTCNEAVTITTNDLTLVGNSGANKAVISGFFPQDRIIIDGATRVNITGFVIENGVFGVRSMNSASFSLTDVDVINNVLGVEFTNGSTVSFFGEVNVNNSQVFGLQVLTGSKLIIEENATCNILNNFLGSQISINSTLFATTGANIIVADNQTIGLSINTGSTAMLFNANIHTHDNGLDGLDVVSAANLEVDGESEIISENNGRDGISIDNSIVNMFGFFSTKPGFPRIVSHANTNNGIMVESTSKLDIGRNSSIASHHNGSSGVRLDDGSSAVLQRSEIHSNNGFLPRNNDHNEDKHNNRPADVVVTFGSRISFNQEVDNAGEVTANMIGLALCDRTSLSRGDVHCKR